MQTIVCICILLGLAAIPISSMATDSVSGDWVGIVGSGKNLQPLRCHLESGSPASSTLTLPTFDLMNEPITEVKSHGSELVLGITKEGIKVELIGKQEGNRVTGVLHAGQESEEFELLRVLQVQPQKYFGIYEFEDGSHVYVRTWDELGAGQLTYFTDDGRVGALHAISEDSFVTGPGIWIPLPKVASIQFIKDGKDNVTGLKWKGQHQQEAKKLVTIREETIRFTDKGISLEGSLVLPAQKGPVPAIVLVHGSGPVTRDFFGPIAYVFAQHGIAVLSYDKRGIGNSQGDWLDADFSDLANDALSAVQYLKSRKEIDSQRIGMFGISQGGWVVPIAASRSRDIAFAILISAPSGTPIEQEVQSTQQEMKLKGAGEAQIKAAVDQLRSQIDSLRSDETKNALADEIKKYEKEGNSKLLHSNGLANPRFLLFYRKIMDFDPTPFLKQVSCPVLIIYGDADRGVPITDNKAKLENALKNGKNPAMTSRVFPRGDHALMLAETGARSEFYHLNRFVPGFFDSMVDWIRHTSPARGMTNIP